MPTYIIFSSVLESGDNSQDHTLYLLCVNNNTMKQKPLTTKQPKI